MLTNLLHYEFKSTGRVVLPIAAGVLVLNIFTNILSHFVQNTSDRLPLAGVAMALLALASAVSLLVVLAICAFIEIQQFYRLLGERGYLMLALPVPIWQHIAAKVICGTVWTLFGMVFFTLCGMLTTDTVSGCGFALDFSRVTAEDVAIWSAMLLIILALITGPYRGRTAARISGLCLCRAVYPAAAAHQHRRLLCHRLYRADGGPCDGSLCRVPRV